MISKLKLFLKYSVLCVLVTVGLPVYALSFKAIHVPHGGQSDLCSESYNHVASEPTLQGVKAELSHLCEEVGGEHVEHSTMMHKNEKSYVILNCVGNEQIEFRCTYPISEHSVTVTPRVLLLPPESLAPEEAE